MSLVGPESSTTGPDFATEGPDTGGGVLSTYHCRHLGVSCPYGGPTTTLLNMAENLGVTWVRFSTEITDLYSTPNNTSNPGTLDLTGVAAQIAAVHARTGADGNPMRVILDVMGVTRQVNPNSGSSDPDTGGGHGHWFATDSTGRGRVAAWTVALANLLDPAVDIIELGNEYNNAAFNHNGGTTNNTGEAVGASASVVAAQMLAQIDAVRASGPAGLPIMSGAIMSFGNWRNATDVAGGLTGPDWLAAMIAAQPTLASTHQPDIWSYHDYVNFLTTFPQDGVLVVNGDLAMGGSGNTGNPGWGTSQMIRFRDVLNFVGATDPNDGSAAKIAITEWGASYTAGPYAADQAGQDLRVGQHLFNYEVAFNAGWMPITTYYNDAPGDDKALFTSSSTGSITTAGARIRTLAHQTDSTVTTNPPVAAIGASPLRPVAGQSVQFTDASTGGAGTSWVWGFGDGGFSASQNPTHTFAAAGTYLVQLTVTNADGNSSASVNFQIFPVVTPPPPPVPAVVAIEIGVPPTPGNTPSAFVVGDPVRGIVGSPTYTIPDRFTYFPITGDVQSVQITRGVNRPLQRTNAGTCTVVVRNDRTDRGTAANYDPSNWLSPYFPYLGPRSRIRVSIDGIYVYTGDITDVPVEDVTDNVVSTTFNCVDPSARLNRPITWKPEAVHSGDRRIARILEGAGWEDDTFLTPGSYTWQRGTVQDGAALDQVQDVAVGEGGMAFCNARGTMLFLNRAALATASPVVTYSDDPAVTVRYSGITRNVGLDLIYNQATVHGLLPDPKATIVDGTIHAQSLDTTNSPGTARDEDSIRQYGVLSYDATLPMSNILQRSFRAQQIVNDYKAPQPRFDTVTIPAHRYTVTQRKTLITNRELGDVVTIERVPPGGPIYGATGGVLSLRHNIVGIDIRADATERSCWVTFTLTRQLGH